MCTLNCQTNKSRSTVRGWGHGIFIWVEQRIDDVPDPGCVVYHCSVRVKRSVVDVHVGIVYLHRNGLVRLAIV